MPSLKDLFKKQPLPTQENKVAAEVFDIRNSKDIRITTANGVLNTTVFPLVQNTLRSSGLLTNRKKETVIESELVGLRTLKILSAPVLYNREILRIVRQTTNSVEFMKTASNGGTDALKDFERTGIIGKLIDKGQALAENITSKLGIELPQRLIPSRVAYNKKFKEELEPNTMLVLAKIKKDGAGNLVGKFLQKNINIGPPKMTVKIVGAIITELKKEARKKLFGSPLEGAKNLAKKDQDGILYDRKSFYGIGGTVIPEQSDITLRNDLSTILDARRVLWETAMKSGDTAAKITAGIPNLPIQLNNLLNRTSFSVPSPFTPISDLIKDAGIKTKDGIALGRKAGQRELAKPENKNNDFFIFSNKIKYSDTVDADIEDISLRNDLSTTLEKLNTAIALLAGGGIGPKVRFSPLRSDITKTTRVMSPKSDRSMSNSLETKLGLFSGSDRLNQSTTWYSEDGNPPKDADDRSLDDYDLLPFRFYSISKKIGVSFRAIITGLSETITPSWDSSKFIGNPYSFYTYGGVERSVAFSFKIYASNPNELKKMWEKLSFLNTFAYPQQYADPYVTAPFLKFTLGNMYKNKEGFIESLSFTIDDNAHWETGIPHISNTKDEVDDASLVDYKLPTLIEVQMNIKFIESQSTFWDGNTPKRVYYYGGNDLVKTESERIDNLNTDGSSQTPTDLPEVLVRAQKVPNAAINTDIINNYKKELITNPNLTNPALPSGIQIPKPIQNIEGKKTALGRTIQRIIKK